MKFVLKVIKGSGRGKKLGFPTLNFEMPASEATSLPFGIYRCFVKTYSAADGVLGALFYGPREMFGEMKPSFEIHLLDGTSEFPPEPIGKSFEVIVREKIREVQTFSSEEKLQEAVKQDLALIRKMSEDAG